MELFEEALRRWEQALTFRNRQAEDEACGSIKMGAGDAIAEENVDDIISTEFIHKLEALLQRAYRLQEEFEATLGASDPNSLADDIGKMDILYAFYEMFAFLLYRWNYLHKCLSYVLIGYLKK
ncbi:Mitoguardin 1 [Saguinus oedipus]|uniref:Mitoguardin 1 n=1 Tax=Saguinus oedipus TaxID=9490 RepID=A0ABQ9VDA2_SAGOE|nr:Mitoguardin 1 [Saguinus oedipus]